MPDTAFPDGGRWRGLFIGTLSGFAAGSCVAGILFVSGLAAIAAERFGGRSAVEGLAVHIVLSTLMGSGFGLLNGAATQSLRAAVVWAIIYAEIIWLAGILVVVPARFGLLPANDYLALATRVFIGHALFGLILGATYWLLNTRLGAAECSSEQQERE